MAWSMANFQDRERLVVLVTRSFWVAGQFSNFRNGHVWEVGLLTSASARFVAGTLLLREL